MAKLSEYLAKVFADSNIEIPENSIIEQNQEPSTESSKETEAPATTPPPTEIESKVDYESEYKNLQARVKELEDANFKLIKHLPVQEDVKSIEQMIYESVHGVRGEMNNANGDTSTRS